MSKVKAWLFSKFEIVLPGTIRAYYSHEFYQLSDPLINWIEEHKSFRDSLKLRHPRRFKKIPYLITSHTPSSHSLHKDQVIGLWYLDLMNFTKGRHPYFKQDFVVNVEEKHKSYISFAQDNYVHGDYVEPVSEFFKKYGSGGAYYHRGKKWEHHYNDVQDLPDTRLQRLAKSLIIEHGSN